MESSGELVGNTKKRPTQRKNYFFTWNNYPSDAMEILERKFYSLGCDYAFQPEIGKYGTPHLQGCINLKKAMRWTEFNLPTEIHWEKTRCIEKAIDYCTKIETRNGKIYTNIERIERMDEIDLKDWQKDIIEIIKQKPDPRKIYWFYDKKGGIGKSEFTRYLCLIHKAILLSGKAADMKYGVMKYAEKHDRYPKIIIIDLPRTFDSTYLSYSGIEEIKNGMFFNTKYECDMVIFNRPHIIIFANKEPENLQNLSEDRWIIKELL